MAAASLTLVLFALAAVPLQAQDPPSGLRPTMDEYKAGKAAKKEAAEAVAAKESKMSAVDKVIDMMEDLQIQVMAEGAKEAATYDKFSCFCKTSQADKSAAISKGEDDQAELTTAISGYSTKRDELDSEIDQLEKDIAQLAKDMKKAETTRAATKSVYDTDAADMSAAIFALENAIKELKASKTSASDTVKLLQVQSAAKTVRTAVQLADTLGLLTSKDSVAMFLQSGNSQEPSVEMQDYKFHSGDIIATLEKLFKDFKSEKAALDAEEVKSVQDFMMNMQGMTDMTAAKKKEVAAKQEAKATKIDQIATASQELTVTSSTLLDDQKYLSELNSMCSSKAETWDARNKVRTDELSALTGALAILKTSVTNKTTSATMRLMQQGKAKVMYGSVVAKAIARDRNAMEALEAQAEEEEAEAAPVGFLQRRQLRRAVQPHAADDAMLQESARAKIVQMLKGGSAKLRSTLLAGLASHIEASSDPFAKIKVLIQQMIDHLLDEESSEATEKGFCDKNTMAATMKRDKSSKSVEELNALLAGLEATRDKQMEQKSHLKAEIQAINAARGEDTEMRQDENAENANTVSEAKAGLKAINEAIDILEKFYKTAAKATVSLAQQSPTDDAPETTFDIGEAYVGSQAASGGIIGMMDVIKSDFVRTIKETTKAETEAQKEYEGFMTASGMSLAEKTTSEAQVDKLLTETLKSINDDKVALDTSVTELKTAVETLISLKERCIDTGMSYDERVANREDEIADLKKALCILENYEEYGPDGEGDAC
mmetsp:Transcript_154631/g.281081  ORF Transcript_154631/g.281081 Transcript_154631/m.281081 type:complete len:773 (+) Transcript_154631:67-2385(+)